MKLKKILRVECNCTLLFVMCINGQNQLSIIIHSLCEKYEESSINILNQE